MNELDHRVAQAIGWILGANNIWCDSSGKIVWEGSFRPSALVSDWREIDEHIQLNFNPNQQVEFYGAVTGCKSNLVSRCHKFLELCS